MCLFRMKASFVASGSLDCTVKVWDLPADLTAAEESIQQLTPRTTEKAHDKVKTQNSVEGRKFNTTVLDIRPPHTCVPFAVIQRFCV